MNVVTIRALIIEDDLFINKLLQEALEAKAIDVRCCKNGADAKNYLNEENFELIITDILMPQVDGIEISKFIKNQSRNADASILAISSGAHSIDRDLALRSAGLYADETLAKPFNKQKLYSKLSSMGLIAQ